MTYRRRRSGERGQVVVITAMMATVIFGGMALSVDLSVHTYNQRTLQNVADSAALAGATDLGATPTSTQQQSAITDAVSALTNNLGGTWSGAASTSFTNSSSIAGYKRTVTSGGYTAKISTPPETAKSSTNATAGDVEVDLYNAVNNSFAGVLGVPTSTIGAHAVAYHSGPPSPYNYTFFAATEIDSGNQQESIQGDAYVGNGYSPQSQGKAGLCVYEIPEATNDNDSDSGSGQDNDIDDQGHAVFASVAPSVGNDPTYHTNLPTMATACPGSGGFNVETAQSTGAYTNCPLGATAATDTNGIQCVMANPTVPTLALPTPTSTSLCSGGSATVTNATAAGIYKVAANCAVTVDFSSGDVNCVDLILSSGATVSVNDKKGQNFMTSYDFSTGDSAGYSAIKNLSPLPTDVTATCPGASTGTNPDPTGTHAGLCIICQNYTATGTPVTLSNGSTGCCSDSLFVGTVFLPGSEVSFRTNQAMEDVGQVYCQYWAVQSGNHPNPVVTYDSGDMAAQAEVLRLVE